MKLLIIPGGSDPYLRNNEQSSEGELTPAYDLVKKEALNRGYSEVILPSYPGHHSSGGGELTVNSSFEAISTHIEKIEKLEEPYVVFCRSYGCQVFMFAIKNMALKNVKKATLWGPIPYYIYFQHLLVDFTQIKSIDSEKGQSFSESLFKSIYPIEISINEININFPIQITSGSEDKHYQKEFHGFLSSINKNQNIQFPSPIPHLKHTVTEPSERYFNLIF
ncbi:MAG: hypothetical protein WDZ80_07480 [Candidatus Paceibacterota bacterium]